MRAFRVILVNLFDNKKICMQFRVMSSNQSQTILFELRRKILRGELRAGQKLRASHLEQTMGSSRTPIKEALVVLEAEGLLNTDKSGYSVRSFDIEDVYTSIEIRGLLEAHAVQKAAQNGVSDQSMAQLRTLIDEMDQIINARQFEQYETLNDRFHRTLTACANSAILSEEIERSYRLPFAAPSAFPDRGHFGTHFAASLSVAQMQHCAIVDAIEARDGLRGFFIMREHARLAFGNIKEAIAKNPSLPQLALVQA